MYFLIIKNIFLVNGLENELFQQKEFVWDTAYKSECFFLKKPW